MRHAKVAQPPGQRGDDAQRAKAPCRAAGPVVALGDAQIARQRLCVGEYVVHAAGQVHAEEHDNHKRGCHEHGLDEICGGDGQKAA